MPPHERKKAWKGATLEVIMELNGMGRRWGPRPTWFLIDEKHNRVVNLSKSTSKVPKASKSKSKDHLEGGDHGEKPSNGNAAGGNASTGNVDGGNASTDHAKGEKQDEGEGKGNKEQNASTQSAGEVTAEEPKKSEGATKHEEAKKDDGVAKPANKPAGPLQTDAEPYGFTPEQDAKLLEMKLAGKTWREIGAAIGQPKSTCPKRYKQIKPREQAKQDKGKSPAVAEGHKEAKNGSAAGKDGKQAGHTEQPKQPSSVKSNGHLPGPGGPFHVHAMPAYHDRHGTHFVAGMPTPVPSRASSCSVPYQAWTGRQANNFTPEEAAALYHSIRCDEDEMYERLASRYYDQTGKRLHRDDIRDACRGLRSHN